MNWWAWAISIVLHAAIAAALLNLTTANPSLERPVRWEVQMALTAPPPPPLPPSLPEPPATPLPAPIPQAPVQALPPPTVAKARPTPKLPAQRPKPPPIATVKPSPPKRNPPPPPRQPPSPIPERSVSNPRKPLPPSSATAKASSRSPKPKTVERFSDAPSRPTSQEFLDSPRSAFRETRSAATGDRTDASRSADSRPTRESAPSTNSGPARADWQAALRAKLREMRVYPPIARRLGQEGTVMLSIEISAHGDLRGLSVRQSSGHPVLDQAAQQLARNAIAALRGQLLPPGGSRLEIPIAYRLDR